jgi:hypothetical protein
MSTLTTAFWSVVEKSGIVALPHNKTLFSYDDGTLLPTSSIESVFQFVLSFFGFGHGCVVSLLVHALGLF